MNPLLLGWFDNLDWHFWKGALLFVSLAFAALWLATSLSNSETYVDEEIVNGHTYIKIGCSKNFIHAAHCQCRKTEEQKK